MRPLPSWCTPSTGESYTPVPDGLRAPDGLVVPVTNGIPRFVPTEKYAGGFGLQWNRFRRTQLDSVLGLPLSRDRLRDILGDGFAQLRGATVLECGCGAGRYTEVLLAEGARVVSIDLSSAVDANAASFPIGEEHRVAQADIMALPLPPESFDFVICLGVIQHTPDPEATIAALWRHVAPGGMLAFDHYAPGHAGRGHSTKPFVRAWLRGRPSDEAMRITDRLVDLFFPVHVAVRRFYPAWFVLSRISPITTYLRWYPSIPLDVQRQLAYLDTHDSLTDYFKHERSAAQIERTLAGLGAERIRCGPGGNGVAASARRAVRVSAERAPGDALAVSVTA